MINCRNNIFTLFALLLCVSCLLEESYSISGIDYFLYLCFAIVSVVWSLRNRISFPSNYWKLFLSLLLVIGINQIINPYSTKLAYFVIGTICTSLPFIHYILSYGYRFEEKDIKFFFACMMKIVILISLIPFVESFVLRNVETTDAILGSNIIRMGFYASLCNVCLIFSLALYYNKRCKKYLCYGLLYIFIPVVIVQVKAILGSILIMVSFYYFTSRKSKTILYTSFLVSLSIPILFSIPQFSNKISGQVNNYLSEEAKEGTARTVLYLTAFKIANDKFPFGSGQGTFGSLPSNMYESPVYEDYGIDKVWGLSYDNDVNFRFDTHWSSILGECGYLGAIIYLLLFFYPLKKLQLRNPNKLIASYNFVIYTTLIVIFIESFALSLPNRLGFIFIYSGLLPLIKKRIMELSSKTIHG